MNLSWLKFYSARPPFGLDISDRCLRAVQLKKSGGQLTLRAFAKLTLPAGVIQQGEIQSTEILTKAIKKLLTDNSGAKINSREVVAVLPETKTFVKIVNLTWPNAAANPANDGAKKKNELSLPAKTKIIEQLLSRSLAEDIPLPWSAAAVDYCWLNNNLKKIGPGQSARLLVGVAPKKTVQDYTAALTDSGLTPVALEIEGLAIARACLPADQPRIATNNEPARILVDLGANRTGLIVCYQGLVHYSLSVPVSGQQITAALALALKVSPAEAEKIKLTYDLTKNSDPLAQKIITSQLEKIIQRLQAVKTFCRLNLAAAGEVEIILSGGGANWPGLPLYLQNRLSLNVSRANPWLHLAPPPKKFPLNEALSYPTAIGLALAGYYDHT